MKGIMGCIGKCIKVENVVCYHGRARADSFRNIPLAGERFLVPASFLIAQKGTSHLLIEKPFTWWIQSEIHRIWVIPNLDGYKFSAEDGVPADAYASFFWYVCPNETTTFRALYNQIIWGIRSLARLFGWPRITVSHSVDLTRAEHVWGKITQRGNDYTTP